MIAIIGILVSLLMPAVQSAREAARRVQCKNNLKQLGLGFQSHATVHGHYPTGGWGHYWTGDPDRGYGLEQPGGWIYNVLPYIEAENVRAIGAGLSSAAKRAELGRLKAVVLPAFICTSRRLAIGYPVAEGSVNSDPATAHAKTDYAGNGGEFVQVFAGPATLEEGDGGYDWPDWLTSHTGITHLRSTVTPAHIRDGLSNTYMVGEKYLSPDFYTTGTNGADNNSLYQGHDWDTLRWANAQLPPTQDREGDDNWQRFGSAHSGGAQFVFCDGSVHTINYSVDPETYRRLGNRNDRLPVDISKQ